MGYVPAQPNVYQGKQIVFNSDRILFNAKNDSILMYSDKSIGMNTQGSINIDNKGLFVINSKSEIYLGLKGKEAPTEPALLGDKTGTYLKDILTLIQELTVFMASEFKVTVPMVGVAAPGTNDIGSFIQKISYMKSDGRLGQIKSKKVKLV